MARNSTLGTVLSMVKAQLGYSLTANVAVADDQQLYTLIDIQQQMLAAQFSWPFLELQLDQAATPNTRYYPLPDTGFANINFERPVMLEVFYTARWQPVDYGIGSEEYNYIDSDNGQTLDPIQRWRMMTPTPALTPQPQYEVWPVPVTPQKLRFTGQQNIRTLKTAGSYDPTLSVDLDDLLISLFVASAKLLELKKENAQLKAQEAQARLNFLRGSYPDRESRLFYGQAPTLPKKKVVPLVVVHG